MKVWQHDLKTQEQKQIDAATPANLPAYTEPKTFKEVLIEALKDTDVQNEIKAIK